MTPAARVARASSEKKATSSPQDGSRSARRALFWGVLALSLVVRLPGLGLPLIDEQPWRQTDTAAIARNFYEEGLDIWRPRVDWRGITPGYVECEFPLYPALVAVGYRAVGGAEEWVARLVAALCSVAGAAALYWLVRGTDSWQVAIWAAGLYAIYPLNIFYGRAVVPEALMLACSCAGLAAFDRWVRRGGIGLLIAAFAATTLAFMVKLPTLCLGVPLLYLALSVRGSACWKRMWFWGFFIGILAPPALWYWHAHELYRETGLTFGIWGDEGYRKFGSVALWTSFEFYFNVMTRFFGVLLTPVGAALALVGFVLPTGRVRPYFYHVWLAALVVYIFAAAEGVRVLNYYLLPFAPVAAAFGARSLVALWRSPLINRTLFGRRARTGLMATLVALLAFQAVMYAVPKYVPKEFHRTQYDLGQRVALVTPPDALVVVVDYDANVEAPDRAQNPVFLYYAHRKGWQILPQELTIERMETLRAAGATVLVAPLSEVLPQRDLFGHLKERYTRILKDPKWLVLQSLAR